MHKLFKFISMLLCAAMLFTSFGVFAEDAAVAEVTEVVSAGEETVEEAPAADDAE